MKAPAPDWRALSEALWERSAGACERCGRGLVSPDDAERHHRLLRSRGGKHTLANLLLLCGDCHRWAHAHPWQATERGAMVPGWCDPAAMPVQHALHKWVLLADDGSTTAAPPPGAEP